MQVFDLPFIGVNRKVWDLPPVRVEKDSDTTFVVRTRGVSFILNKQELTEVQSLLRVSDNALNVFSHLQKYDRSSVTDLLDRAVV